MTETFSVCQFFEDGSYEYVRRGVPAPEAMSALAHYASSVAARMGITVRVIVTDVGDCINAEWVRGEGFKYPPELVDMELEHGEYAVLTVLREATR